MTIKIQLAALPLALAVAAAPATGKVGQLSQGDQDHSYYHQHPTWTSCRQGPGDEVGSALDHAGARCAQITVPLDYSRPAGPAIHLGISRLPATDRTHRIGALLLNNGGPGQPSLGMPLDTRRYLGDAGSRYDLIGMDPRFVGRSTPIDCHWPVGMWIRSAGSGRAGFERQVHFQKDLAERCRRADGRLLPYASTRNTARDMDVVRAALGERRLSYLGYSYGGYLGAVYQQMFPGRTDRVVLDSPPDPDKAGALLLRGTEPASERALRAWADWAAARPYGLGATRSEVLATVRRVVRAASREPLHVGAYRLDEHIVPYLIYLGVGSDHAEARAAFSAEMRVLEQAAHGKQVQPTPELDGTLHFLLDSASSADVSPAAAILCADRTGPRDPASYWRAVSRDRRRHPLFGPLVDNVGPCAFWSAHPREEATTVDNQSAALVVSATGDTATTYRGATAMHRALSGSRLLTLESTIGHGIFGEYGNACIDRNVDAYLLTGRLPAADSACPARK